MELCKADGFSVNVKSSIASSWVAVYTVQYSTATTAHHIVKLSSPGYR